MTCVDNAPAWLLSPSPNWTAASFDAQLGIIRRYRVSLVVVGGVILDVEFLKEGRVWTKSRMQGELLEAFEPVPTCPVMQAIDAVFACVAERCSIDMPCDLNLVDARSGQDVIKKPGLLFDPLEDRPAGGGTLH